MHKTIKEILEDVFNEGYDTGKGVLAEGEDKVEKQSISEAEQAIRAAIGRSRPEKIDTDNLDDHELFNIEGYNAGVREFHANLLGELKLDDSREGRKGDA